MAQGSEITVASAEDFSDSIRGVTIADFSQTPEGAHLTLNDGRMLIIVGNFIVYVGRLESQTTH